MAEDDLRDRTPDVGERGPKLVVAQRRIRLPHQHGLVKPAAQQIAAELAYLREVETKQLLARDRPPEPACPVGDKAVHRDAHRVDQHGFKLIAPATNEIRYRVGSDKLPARYLASRTWHGRRVRLPRPLAGRPFALTCSGEVLQLPFMHARKKVLPIRG